MNFYIIPKEMLVSLFLLALGLVVNILAGTGFSELKNIFNREQFKTGVSKAAIVFLIIVLISIAAAIDDSLVIEGTPILEYILLAIKFTYAYYFAQAGIKVVKMISFKSDEGLEEIKKENEQ